MLSRDRLRRAFGAGACLTGVAAAIVIACGDPYSASDGEPPPAEAGADAPVAPDAAPDVIDPCQHVVTAGPPLVDDAPDVELPPFFVAVRTVSFVSTPADVHGFDLDGVCTCDTRPTAHDGGASCNAKAPGPTCDQDGGVDNAFAATAANLSPFFALDSVPSNLINQGRRTTLVQVGRYNGRANDKEVAVGIALSDGIRAQGCPTSKQNPNNGIWSPGWCGSDPWSFLADSVIPSTKQPLVQGVGYVNNGVISFQLPGNLLLPFNEVSSTPVSSPVFSGVVVPLGEDLQPRDFKRAPATELEKRLFSIERATIGGRVKAVDALAALGSIEIPGDGGSTYVCQLAFFPTLRTGVCGATDIASTKGLDFDPNAKCDSLSAGISFTAFPVLPGEVRTPTPQFNPCAPTANGQPAEAGSDPPYVCP